MGANTKVEWCDATFNPWRGCTKVSAGCANCYAETQAKRNAKTLGVWGPSGSRVLASASMWAQPLKWDREAAAAGERRRVFCASMADVFEDWKGGADDAGAMTCPKTGEELSVNDHGHIWPAGWPSLSDGDDWGIRSYTMDDARARLFRLIAATPNLDWLLLTKRPENVLRMTHDAWTQKVHGHVSQNAGDGRVWAFPANVWIGTSVENQSAADERIPHLLKIPAAVRFLSCEPLLGPVNLAGWLQRGDRCRECGSSALGYVEAAPGARLGNLPPLCTKCGGFTRSPIHWVIVGGESGAGARPMHEDWARSLRDQCEAAGVAFHFKQWGEWVPESHEAAGINASERVSDEFVKLIHQPGGGVVDYEGKYMHRVGKKAAGRMLDGRTWDELPAVPQ